MIKNSEILKFFPQPVFKYKIKDYEQVNAQLSGYIYDLKKRMKKGLIEQMLMDGIQKILT